MEKWKIYSHLKNILWIENVNNVAFTQFLHRNGESKFLQIPHCGMRLVLKVIVTFCTFFCESKKKKDVKHLLWMYLVISVTFTTTKYCKLCLNKYNSVEIMEITVSHFFDKNIVKATFSLKSCINQIFFRVREFLYIYSTLWVWVFT